MFRHLLPVALAVVIVVALAARRARRLRADATPELHKHPERLDQTLDSTDDA